MAAMRAQTTRTTRTTMKLALMLVAMALAVLLAAPPARADTAFTVNSTTDAPDANPGDGACSTAAAECTLRAAIEEANAQAAAEQEANKPDVEDVIGFDPSVRGTITLGGSELLIDSNLKIVGPGADKLSVDANGQSRVFWIRGGTVGLSGLTITGGSIDSSGGGILIGWATLTVSESTITGNTAPHGGGIANEGGTLTVSDSTISANTGEYDGGGIYNDGGTLRVSKSTISGNTARQGGGISVPYGSGDHGGGSLKVERSTISGNTATMSGGGIRSSTRGVSIFTTDKTTIRNSTISGNTAEQDYGGGVYNNNGITEIEHSTITNNSAPSGIGGGVASQGDNSTRTEVYSSIVAANTSTDTTGTDPGTDADYVNGSTNSFVSEGHNLVGDGNATAAFDKSGDQKDVQDPGLEPLSLNAPGTTETHALKATSLALDAGPPASQCPPPATDQRGVARPQGGRCDVGAFELERTNAAPTATADSYSVGEDATLNVPAPGVLANDSDPDGDALGAVEVSGTNHGTLALRRDGSFSYTPNKDYSGSDSFTYRASDGDADSNAATVNITVKDTTKPTVTSVVPAENVKRVGPRANVSAFFSEAMGATTINRSTFKLYKKGSTTAIRATVTYGAATKRAVLNPAANLKRGVTYKAVVGTGARDHSGNPLDQRPGLTGNQGKVWFFTVKN